MRPSSPLPPPAYSSARAMAPDEWGLLLTLSLLWGGSFLFNAIAVRDLPPFTVVLLRVGLAALALHGICALRGLPVARSGAVWRAFLVMGLLNNALPFSLIVWGQTQISSGLASILNATTPLFTALVAHAFTTDERLNAGRVAGVLFGLLGVAVLIGGDALAALTDDVAGQLACLSASLCYAFAGVYGRRFKAMGVAPMQTATGMLTASSLLLLPLVLLVDQPWNLPAPGWDAIGAVAGLALVSTALAFILYFRLLARIGASNLVLVTFLIPAFAILLGVAVLSEAVEIRHLAGLLLIGLGLAAIDGRPVRALRAAVGQRTRQAD